jgi:ABC-type uncharacterized transport system substrate-binding protein
MDFAFFTFVALAGQELQVGTAADYWLEHTDGILSLHFTLPFARLVPPETKVLVFSVFDPSYFIAFDPAKSDPVKPGAGAPKTCKMGVAISPADARTTALREAMSEQQRGALDRSHQPVTMLLGWDSRSRAHQPAAFGLSHTGARSFCLANERLRL